MSTKWKLATRQNAHPLSSYAPAYCSTNIFRFVRNSVQQLVCTFPNWFKTFTNLLIIHLFICTQIENNQLYSKIDSVKIAPYENTHLLKFPPLKFPPHENRPLENCPQENHPQKITPKKTVLFESCHHSREKLKVVTIWSICSHEK